MPPRRNMLKKPILLGISIFSCWYCGGNDGTGVVEFCLRLVVRVDVKDRLVLYAVALSMAPTVAATAVSCWGVVGRTADNDGGGVCVVIVSQE